MLKQSLTDSWSFFKIHFVTLSIIILPIVIPLEILRVVYQYFFASKELVLAETLITMAIGFIAYSIYMVGVIFYMVSIKSGESFDTKSLWRLGVKYWLPYIIVSILIAVAVVFGLLLFVIPGIIFAARYAFSSFDLLLNQSKPLDAMKNSWDGTKGYVWIIIGGYVVITIALYVPYYLVTSLFDEPSISYWVLDEILNIVYSVLSVLYTIFAFRVYKYSKLQHNK
jgi:hypothetical protein